MDLLEARGRTDLAGDEGDGPGRASNGRVTISGNRAEHRAPGATAFSAAGVAEALGQVLGGPLLGLIAAVAGMPATFVVSALLLGPATALLARTWSRESPAVG